MSTSPVGCPHCGGRLEGDGHTVVVHCENVEPRGDEEPDAAPLVKPLHHTLCYRCEKWDACPPCLRGAPYNEDPGLDHCYRDIPTGALPDTYPWVRAEDVHPLAARPRACCSCQHYQRGCLWRGGYIDGKLVLPPPESLTCFRCAERESCPCVDDPYNTDGDCLASK